MGVAPAGRPQVREALLAAAGNPELVNLWAGTGYRNATAEPVATILARLAAEI